MRSFSPARLAKYSEGCFPQSAGREWADIAGDIVGPSLVAGIAAGRVLGEGGYATFSIEGSEAGRLCVLHGFRAAAWRYVELHSSVVVECVGKVDH